METQQTTAEVAQPVPLGIGQRERVRDDRLLGLALAILVGVAVFLLILRLRKTFGMK